MLILVTGPRRSGCTTLARAIAQHMPDTGTCLYVPNPTFHKHVACTADVVVLDCSGRFEVSAQAPWVVARPHAQIIIDDGSGEGPQILPDMDRYFYGKKDDTLILLPAIAHMARDALRADARRSFVMAPDPRGGTSGALRRLPETSPVGLRRDDLHTDGAGTLYGKHVDHAAMLLHGRRRVRAPERYNPEHYIPERYSPERDIPERYTPERYTPQRYTPERYRPDRYGRHFPPGMPPLMPPGAMERSIDANNEEELAAELAAKVFVS